MSIYVKNVMIENYKGIDSLHIELSNQKNCFIGENGSGKTSILESISGYLSRYNHYDINRDVVFTLEVDGKSVPELSKYNIEKVNVLFRQKNKSYHYEFLSIDGMEELIEKKSAELYSLKETYDKHIKEINDVLIEIRTHIMNSKEYMNKESEGLVFGYSIEELDKTISNFADYLTKDKSILPVLFSDLYPDLELTNHRLSFKLFDLEFLPEGEYENFKRSVEWLTIDDHGIKYNVKEMDNYYYGMKEKFDKLKTFLSIRKDKYSKKREKYEYDEDKFYEILYEIRDIRQVIIDVCETYLRSMTLISSSSFEKNVGKNTELKDEEREYVGLFDQRLLEKKVSEYSYGEKWIYHLVKRIVADKSGLICIDEPGMYLNPLYQKKILELFDRLIDNGKQIIYSTHVELLVPFGNEDKVFICYLDNGRKVQINKADLSKISINSELFIGDLVVKAIKKIIIVEGETDKLLFDYYTKRLNDIDETKFDIYDCKGNGIHQALKFSTYMGFDFKAIVDLDQEEDILETLGDEIYNKHIDDIAYTGTDLVDRIEGWMTTKDIKELCRPDKKNKNKMKMNIDKVQTFIDSKGRLSKTFESKIKSTLYKLIKDWK